MKGAGLGHSQSAVEERKGGKRREQEKPEVGPGTGMGRVSERKSGPQVTQTGPQSRGNPLAGASPEASPPPFHVLRGKTLILRR